jgi:uncharacterized protein (DUF1778 family)
MPAKSPEQQAAYDAARKRSEQILLRLTPDEAQRLRAAAASAGVSIADYVVSTVENRPRPIVDLSDVAQIAMATAALAGAPKAIRDLEADLGRLSGRLSHLFTLNYARAVLHRDEIHETLHALQDLMRRVQPEIAAMSAAVAEPRSEIAAVMRAIARELDAN